MSKKTGVTVEEFKSKHEPIDEVRHLRAEVRRLQTARDSDAQASGAIKVMIEELRDAIDSIEPAQNIYKPTGKKDKSPCDFVAQWSDWHMGMEQDPNEVEQLNAMNPEILTSRIKNCVHDQLDWVNLQRRHYAIEHSHELVTGDLVSGDIHQELQVTNSFPTPVQSIRAGELLADAIAIRAQAFKTVTVHFLTVDNHSRLTRKPQAAQAGYNTWGYVVGFYAKERLRSIPNVKFNIYPVVQQVVSVAHRKYLMFHGHGIKGFAGYPWYGFHRKIGLEAIRRLQADFGQFHLGVSGHFHTPVTTQTFWCAGSACGTSTYDHEYGRHSHPSQPSWLVHKEHNEFSRIDWQLRDD